MPLLYSGLKASYTPFKTGLKTRKRPPEDVPCSTPDHCQFEKGRGVNSSGWTRHEQWMKHGVKFVLDRPSTNKEHPPEDVSVFTPRPLPVWKVSVRHTVCKPEPENPRMNILVHVLCSFCIIIMHKNTCLYRMNASYQVCRAIWSIMSIKFAQLFILTKYGQYWVIIRMSVARKYYNKRKLWKPIVFILILAEDSSEIF